MALSDLLQSARRYARAVHAREKSAASDGDSGLPFPIFVVNLARSEPRRHFILGHLRQLGLRGTIHTATDGRTLDLADLDRRGIYRDAYAHEKFSRSLSLAEIGCAMSHAGLYEKIVRENIEVALVIEDDVELVNDFRERLPKVMAELPADWDVLQLYFTCSDIERVSEHLVGFPMKTGLPVGAPGYVLTKAAAQKLLDHLYPIHYPADSFIGRSPRWGTRVYGATPQLVTVNNVFPSTIWSDRNLKTRLVNGAKELIVRLLR